MNTALNPAVTPLIVYAVIALVSCMTSRVREERCEPCPRPVERPCPAVRPAPILPPLPAPPERPTLDKMPAGCGAAFMACLTPEEDAKLQQYYQAVKNWSVQVYALGCARGR